MTQFPNIPDSVKEDIRKRAEERYPEPDKKDFMADRQVIHISRQAYALALCEAWEMMNSVWDACGRNIIPKAFINDHNEAKNEFLNQIFKR